MSDSKKSSEWALFEARQRKQYREDNPRSWAWLKVVGVVVVGIAIGGLAYYLFGRPPR
ncbi:hypothetical protein PX52LOC_04416 [Limnoglobus roseus]|uniref:Uncharacterized protein n=1 Tax=Limnoglobus roseus TaxID=2598579 RepID=A0A5C1AGY9_9BACT|nr:hypothetical protein PX52LOC_04416 [Limnoglobus roseus]